MQPIRFRLRSKRGKSDARFEASCPAVSAIWSRTKRRLPRFLEPCSRGVHTLKFIASPEPLPSESRASWIQRVCGAHGYSMKRFCECVGVGPHRIDWDFGVDAAHWRGLAEDSGRGMQCFERNDRDWALIKQLHRHTIFPFFVDGKPASKWCAACMLTDATPYLRWYWRIYELQSCPYHDMKLATRCPWCQSCMNLSVAGMVPWGRLRGTANLAGCASCGMPFLVDGSPEPSATVDSRIGKRSSPDPINALREVLNRGALSEWPTPGAAAFVKQEHSVDSAAHPQEAPCDSPSDPQITEPYAEEHIFSGKQADLLQEFCTPRAFELMKLNDRTTNTSKVDLEVFFLEKERKRVFGTDFKMLQVHRSPISCKPARKTSFWTPGEATKWSAPLALPTRVRVAKALLIIRREKARQKERALQGLDEDEEQMWINSYVPFYKRP